MQIEQAKAVLEAATAHQIAEENFLNLIDASSARQLTDEEIIEGVSEWLNSYERFQTAIRTRGTVS